VEYVGIDWSYRRASWCALSDAGKVVGEGAAALVLAGALAVPASASAHTRSLLVW
jgi:hypothetical protein